MGNAYVKKCECGSENFTIQEVLIHKASIEEGILEAYSNVSNEIELITCRECGKEYKVSDFSDVQFNY